MNEAGTDFPPGAFDRIDEGDDSAFYAPSRLVTHIDERAIAALTACYRTELSPGDQVLDLMSSWVSHLPPELQLGECVGHGMNAEELAANPRLDAWFVQDLNRHFALPFGSARFDAALCCVSVQYLQNPVAVFTEVRRLLRPGAPFIVSFSNRCFPTKAVAIWRALDLPRHAGLVGAYAERAGFAAVEARLLVNGGAGDPLVAVIARA
ncbi:methyltransferase domain-containing protein [Novosphingobium sp. PS1R-30]|uniref:Methyltransferase domain-containing protein n=1 Tax=Novosphingobium anseongense TaxID=3133436 RepID=A0ABU8S153_9SPHN